MEKLISRDLLSNVQSFSKQFGNTVFEAKAKRQRTKFSFETSVFLSHKHGETEIINQVVALFSGLGVGLYIDWEDNGFPTSTDGSTAQRLKKKISETDKFVLLATETAIASKWCNWELGYGDSCKYPRNIAIMPILEVPDTTFPGSEYLQMYPIITSAFNHLPIKYYVEHNNQKLGLEEWLAQ